MNTDIQQRTLYACANCGKIADVQGVEVAPKVRQSTVCRGNQHKWFSFGEIESRGKGTTATTRSAMFLYFAHLWITPSAHKANEIPEKKLIEAAELMRRLDWTGYPEANGTVIPSSRYAKAACCGREVAVHPIDYRCGDRPIILCNGTRVET